METKANNYAAAASENLLKDALKAAYIQGYKDGQKDNTPAKDEPIIVDGIEYIDLGLPSGTLWAKDFVRSEDGQPLYLTSNEAQSYNIPTEEQFNELKEHCIIKYNNNTINGMLKIIGPNGDYFTLYSLGYIIANDVYSSIYFYMPFKNPNVNGKYVDMMFCSSKYILDIDKNFMGYKIPILTVK